MYVGFHVQYPLFLSDCNQSWIFWTHFRKILKISWKSVKWEPSYSVRIDKQTDMTKLIAAFCNFCECALKVVCVPWKSPHMHSYFISGCKWISTRSFFNVWSFLVKFGVQFPHAVPLRSCNIRGNLFVESRTLLTGRTRNSIRTVSIYCPMCCQRTAHKAVEHLWIFWTSARKRLCFTYACK